MTWWDWLIWFSIYWQCCYLMILLSMKKNDERFRDRMVAVRVFLLSPLWPILFTIMLARKLFTSEDN